VRISKKKIVKGDLIINLRQLNFLHMASGFFAILDDISALMDDVATMSKVATKNTASILGDDLAVNAENATGFGSSREIPVLWAITKGSLMNKAIILPITFILSYYWSQALIYLLVIGGFYLSYEAVHKILDYFKSKNKDTEVDKALYTSIKTDDQDEEAKKIKDAIITDFILSIEIVIIAYSTVTNHPLLTQILTVSVVALIATVGVYGIVALIVRLDDVGLMLIRKSLKGSYLAKIGTFLINILPWIIKSLAVIGTIALLMVSGGIFEHHISYFHNLLPELNSTLKGMLISFVIGLVLYLIVHFIASIISRFKRN